MASAPFFLLSTVKYEGWRYNGQPGVIEARCPTVADFLPQDRIFSAGTLLTTILLGPPTSQPIFLGHLPPHGQRKRSFLLTLNLFIGMQLSDHPV